MRDLKGMKYAAVLVPIVALVLAGGVLAGIGGDGQNDDVGPNQDPPGSGSCDCPQIYDPVVCKQPSSGGPIVGPNPWKRFSNSCFAGCEGYTKCQPAPAEPR